MAGRAPRIPCRRLKSPQRRNGAAGKEEGDGTGEPAFLEASDGKEVLLVGLSLWGLGVEAVGDLGDLLSPCKPLVGGWI